MSQVMHLNIIQGESILSVRDKGVLQLAPIGDVMSAIIAKTIAEGDGWPHDAVYKMRYHMKTWPMGWEKETHDQYFTTREELDAEIARKTEWAMLEDNGISMHIYEWDLGPTKIDYIEYR